MPDRTKERVRNPLRITSVTNAILGTRSPEAWRSGILCGLLAVVMVLACGIGEPMGFEDDWSIGRTAELFAQTGHFVYNGWEAPTVGWLILWAAPFIKAFGYSYLVIRLSMLPIVFATIFLFYQSLIRFGLTVPNASFGALTLGVSPIFLPVASSFMTDIPALFVTILCLVLCQKAVAQRKNHAVVAWLVAAALTNIVGGTVRQSAFLGILCMIPGVGWWQRKRRGVLPAAAILTSIGCIWIFLFLMWYRKQPYSLNQAIIPSSFLGLEPIGFLRTLLTIPRFLLVALLPVIACNTPAALRLPRTAFWGIYTVFSILVLWTSSDWSANQFGYALAYLGIQTPVALIGILAVLALVFLRLRYRSRRQLEEWSETGMQPRADSWSRIFRLLGPYSLGYLLLLLTGGPIQIIWDRYLLGLLPITIVCLLKVHQDRASRGIPSGAIFVLLMVGYGGFAKTQRLHSEHRAIVEAANRLRARNIPRTEIAAGLEYDGETQLDAVGYINNPDMITPAGAYHPFKPPPETPSAFGTLSYSPAIDPRYFIVENLDSDLALSNEPPVEYIVFYPPFHRWMYIQQLRGR